MKVKHSEENAAALFESFYRVDQVLYFSNRTPAKSSSCACLFPKVLQEIIAPRTQAKVFGFWVASRTPSSPAA